MAEATVTRIHLDTSFLIRSVHAGSLEATRLRGWLDAGFEVAISAVAWSEFLCGPVAENIATAARRVVGVPVPFMEEDAVVAARLFGLSGRRRGSMADCMIAATALREQAHVATANQADFTRFSAAGLVLA